MNTTKDLIKLLKEYWKQRKAEGYYSIDFADFYNWLIERESKNE